MTLQGQPCFSCHKIGDSDCLIKSATCKVEHDNSYEIKMTLFQSRKNQIAHALLVTVLCEAAKNIRVKTRIFWLKNYKVNEN